MSEHEADFWQREAHHYRVSVAENVGRLYSLIAVGLPILVTAGAALIAADKVEYLLVITPVVILVWTLVLNTNLDILLKSAYQFRAERMAAQGLKDPASMVTWEEVGGSVGWERKASSPAFWVISTLVSGLMLVGSILLVGTASKYGELFWLDLIVSTVGVAALIVGAVSIMKSTNEVFAGFGLEKREPLKKALARVRAHDEELLGLRG